MAEEEAHGQEAQAPVQEAGAGSLEAMAQEQAAAERAAKEARVCPLLLLSCLLACVHLTSCLAFLWVGSGCAPAAA